MLHGPEGCAVVLTSKLPIKNPELITQHGAAAGGPASSGDRKLQLVATGLANNPSLNRGLHASVRSQGLSLYSLDPCTLQVLVITNGCRQHLRCAVFAWLPRRAGSCKGDRGGISAVFQVLGNMQKTASRQRAAFCTYSGAAT